MVTLSFVIIQNIPNMRYYYTAYLLGSKEGVTKCNIYGGALNRRYLHLIFMLILLGYRQLTLLSTISQSKNSFKALFSTPPSLACT